MQQIGFTCSPSYGPGGLGTQAAQPGRSSQLAVSPELRPSLCPGPTNLESCTGPTRTARRVSTVQSRAPARGHPSLQRPPSRTRPGTCGTPGPADQARRTGRQNLESNLASRRAGSHARPVTARADLGQHRRTGAASLQSVHGSGPAPVLGRQTSSPARARRGQPTGYPQFSPGPRPGNIRCSLGHSTASAPGTCGTPGPAERARRAGRQNLRSKCKRPYGRPRVKLGQSRARGLPSGQGTRGRP
jgi:hypothetical protein